MKRHNLREWIDAEMGFFDNYVLSFYVVVGVEGTLKLVIIGWDMAGEAEESLAPSALPQSTSQ
jgi:hypothetical protein